MIKLTLFCTSHGAFTHIAHVMPPEGDTGVFTQQLTKPKLAALEGSVQDHLGLA